ncbi:MAG: trigger factor, partial [Pseudomonadales bacterium]|nr:trigger factor [Pseudomonadales bacterium]
VQELIGSSKIEVDRDRVDERISELASPYEDPDQAAQLYRSNRQLMSQVETAVLEEQVVDFLVENAKVRELSQSFEEFMQNEDA